MGHWVSTYTNSDNSYTSDDYRRWVAAHKIPPDYEGTSEGEIATTAAFTDEENSIKWVWQYKETTLQVDVFEGTKRIPVVRDTYTVSTAIQYYFPEWQPHIWVEIDNEFYGVEKTPYHWIYLFDEIKSDLKKGTIVKVWTWIAHPVGRMTTDCCPWLWANGSYYFLSSQNGKLVPPTKEHGTEAGEKKYSVGCPKNIVNWKWTFSNKSTGPTDGAWDCDCTFFKDRFYQIGNWWDVQSGDLIPLEDEAGCTLDGDVKAMVRYGREFTDDVLYVLEFAKPQLGDKLTIYFDGGNGFFEMRFDKPISFHLSYGEQSRTANSLSNWEGWSYIQSGTIQVALSRFEDGNLMVNGWWVGGSVIASLTLDLNSEITDPDCGFGGSGEIEVKSFSVQHCYTTPEEEDCDYGLGRENCTQTAFVCPTCYHSNYPKSITLRMSGWRLTKHVYKKTTRYATNPEGTDSTREGLRPGPPEDPWTEEVFPLDCPLNGEFVLDGVCSYSYSETSVDVLTYFFIGTSFNSSGYYSVNVYCGMSCWNETTNQSIYGCYYPGIYGTIKMEKNDDGTLDCSQIGGDWELTTAVLAGKSTYESVSHTEGAWTITNTTSTVWILDGSHVSIAAEANYD